MKQYDALTSLQIASNASKSHLILEKIADSQVEVSEWFINARKWKLSYLLDLLAPWTITVPI